MLVAIYRKILRRNKQGKAPRCDALLGALVRVTRLERAISASQMRRGTNSATPGYSISAMIPRRTVKIKFFLSVVIPVVKATFVPFSATGGNPANADVARLCVVSPHPIPDTATALPKQARYQLRSPPKYLFLLALQSAAPRFFRHRRRSAMHPKASALPTALHPEIFIFICAAIRCALLCSPGLRFLKKILALFACSTFSTAECAV